MIRAQEVRVGAVTLAILASLGVSGCSASSDDDRYGEICVDEATLVRLEDSVCDVDDGSGGHGWYYVHGSSTSPRVGAKASGGSFTRPSTGTVARVPSTGGFGTFKGGSGG